MSFYSTDLVLITSEIHRTATDFIDVCKHKCDVGVCVLCAAKVACVKSRDMHWALVAHREQRDVNLSSLRMLVVADGSNPCENTTLSLVL